MTEVLYALGLGDRVVGVTRFCNYPPEARSKPKIGDYINPNLEAIATLKPDLVVIQTNPVRLAERLAALRLKSLEINQENVAAIYQSISAIGDATGTTTRARQLIGDLRASLDRVKAQASSLPRTRVMFVVGRAPNRLDGLVVVGKASYLSELISLAGGENVFADAVAAYPQISLEEVLARNPDVIIDFGDMADTSSVSDQHKQQAVALWNRAPSIKAVRQHQVYAVAADIFVVPGPRAVQAAESIFNMLHPARSQAAVSSAAPGPIMSRMTEDRR
jgi:iron complex transport system substrate-binding protein